MHSTVQKTKGHLFSLSKKVFYCNSYTNTHNIISLFYSFTFQVAIKRMKRSFRSWEDTVGTRELQSLKSLQHPQIVQLFEVIRESNETVYFVFEYMPDGNLYEFLKKCTPRKSDPPGMQRPKLDHAKISSFTKQVIQGLAYLHARSFIHRDIKPENLLIRGNTIKIADFNLARAVSKEPLTEYVSTRWYRAPEVCLRAPIYGTPIDMFAVGCIVAELYSRLPLFPANSEIDLVDRMVKILGMPNEQSWPEGIQLANKLGFSFASFADEHYGTGEEPTPLEVKVPTASSPAIAFMKQLLQWNPESRPSANQALQNPYFSPFTYVSPKPTTATSELVKKRSLNLVTATPGHFYAEGRDDESSTRTWEDLSPMPLSKPEMSNYGAISHKKPRYSESFAVGYHANPFARID